MKIVPIWGEGGLANKALSGGGSSSWISVRYVWLPKYKNYWKVAKTELTEVPEISKLRLSNCVHVRWTIWSMRASMFCFDQTAVAWVIDHLSSNMIWRPLVSILPGFCLNWGAPRLNWGIGQSTTNVYCGYVKSHNPYRNLAPVASSDHTIQWSLHPSLLQLTFDINYSIHWISYILLLYVRWCRSQCSPKQVRIDLGWQRNSSFSFFWHRHRDKPSKPMLFSVHRRCISLGTWTWCWHGGSYHSSSS